MKRSGSTDLPLHNGYVPDWLYQSMSKLGFDITEAIITEYGKEEFLRRMCVGGLPTGKVGMGRIELQARYQKLLITLQSIIPILFFLHKMAKINFYFELVF